MNLTAQEFSKRLESLKSETELQKYHKYFDFDEKNPKDDQFIGVRMGDIFKLAKEFEAMDLSEVEKLLESPIHEMRVGAVSIMDYVARNKKSTDQQKKAVFDLYLKRHDRINTWDLVDRAVIYVVGQYLADLPAGKAGKPRDILYKLAKSKMMAERRSAIVATAYFMMKLKETDDTFKLAEILMKDQEDLIHKATGWMLRIAGDVNREEFLEFLDKHATQMPRVMLRYSIEKLDKAQKDHYMKMK